MAKTKVIAVANQKGGVGKSTSVYCIGAGLAIWTAKKVLLVDVDPQGDLTKMLGLRDPDSLPVSLGTAMYDVIGGTQPTEHRKSGIITKALISCREMKTCPLLKPGW